MVTECDDPNSVPHLAWAGGGVGGVHFVIVIIIYDRLNEGKTLALG